MKENKNRNKKTHIKNIRVRSYDGNPEHIKELVNKYGTYEIQDTADTENAFPLIAQGYPSKYENKTKMKF